MSHFLWIKFNWHHLPDNYFDAYVSQESFIDNLAENLDLSFSNIVTILFRSGHTVGFLPHIKTDENSCYCLTYTTKILVCSLLWVSGATSPDLSAVTALLIQHVSNPYPDHIGANRYSIRYLKVTKHQGIKFSSQSDVDLSARLHFLVIPSNLLPLTDANWGGNDQSAPDPNHPQELLYFKTRSLSGFIILHNCPIHWISKRQKVTARSLAGIERYCTDKCVKALLRLHNILDSMVVKYMHIPSYSPIKV